MTTTDNTQEKKPLNFKSCFDIIGPVMIGPSSSHTAGAISIGIVANKLFQTTPKKVSVNYYESFAETHKGHGTDYAIVSGVLGFATDDLRVPNALEIAAEQGIEVEFIEMPGDSPVQHANTACVNLQDGEHEINITGISVGGGTIEIKYIEIDRFAFEPQGTLPILIAITTDESIKYNLQGKLYDNNVDVNVFNEYECDGTYLYQFDLNSQPPKKLREQLLNIDKETQIILL